MYTNCEVFYFIHFCISSSSVATLYILPLPASCPDVGVSTVLINSSLNCAWKYCMWWMGFHYIISKDVNMWDSGSDYCSRCVSFSLSRISMSCLFRASLSLSVSNNLVLIKSDLHITSVWGQKAKCRGDIYLFFIRTLKWSNSSPQMTCSHKPSAMQI